MGVCVLGVPDSKFEKNKKTVRIDQLLSHPGGGVAIRSDKSCFGCREGHRGRKSDAEVHVVGVVRQHYEQPSC